MAYAEKRDGKLTGFWYGERLIKKTGERFRRRHETRKLALGYEAYIDETGQEPPDPSQEGVGGPTFGDWLTLAEASNPHWKKNRDRPGVLRREWLRKRCGHMHMPEIDAEFLEALVQELEQRRGRSKGTKLSDGTINNYLSGISAVFTYAFEHPKKGERPVVVPSLPWRIKSGARIHWFSLEQEEVLVPYLIARGERAEALSLRVLCATGLRWSEFLGLEPHQCQAEWILLDETKTDEPRDVPIDAALMSELKAMVVTKTVPTYYAMRKALKAAVKACGFSPLLGIHNARHGTATRLIKKGVNPVIVQKFLGHKDIKTTMNYVHVENNDLYEAMKKLSPQRGYSGENVGSETVVSINKAI
jgi:integrase